MKRLHYYFITIFYLLGCGFAFAHSDKLSTSQIYSQLPEASGENQIITIGTDSFNEQENSLADFELGSVVQRSKNETIAIVDKVALAAIGEINHQKFKRCGGFILHDSLKEAKEFLKKSQRRSFSLFDLGIRDIYNIDQQKIVNPLISQISEKNILSTIQKLSSYPDRYYKNKSGVEAAEWIANQLKIVAKNRSDISVQLYKHNKWIQPSVIATIPGKSSDKIIIGGHLDSINQSFFGSKLAPGADDNASGIATWMEVYRVLVENNFKPEKTLIFIGYAAEEVGLLGSKEIATEFKKKNEKVIGVLQLDMTNFKGNPQKDIFFMTDYTNQAQNNFLGTLVDTYVKVPWGQSKCGYGCSDHASWHGQGYPASIPFEASMETMNKALHTTKDTLAISNNSATHAAKFSKLALAYAVELSL